MKHAGNALLLLVFSALALVGVEAAYRVYLHGKLPEMMGAEFEDDPTPTFSFFGYPPPWIFDAALGFRYNHGPWLSGQIADGKFVDCSSSRPANRLGNYGKLVGDYSQADLKIFIMGSSYTQVGNETGDLVNIVLQRRLAERLGRTVSVLNFSRDASGVLSFFQIASSKMEEMKPDLILFVFNTAALHYQRYWRALSPVQEHYWRLAFTLEPDEALSNASVVALQSQLVSDLVTPDWCEELRQARDQGHVQRLDQDPVVRGLIAAHESIRREMTVPEAVVDYWSLSQSFVLNKILYADPYYKVQVFKERTVHGPIGYHNYNEDEEFVGTVARLNSSGIPYLLVHIPTLAEMRAGPMGRVLYGVSGAPEDRERSLVKSLEDLTDRPLISLYQYYDSAVKAAPLKLVYSEENSHPSPLGVQAMAEALMALLFEQPETVALLDRAGESAGKD